MNKHQPSSMYPFPDNECYDSLKVHILVGAAWEAQFTDRFQLWRQIDGNPSYAVVREPYFFMAQKFQNN